MVDAVASDTGPDIIAIHNDWLPKHKGKIVPANNDILSLDEYNQKYVKAVYDDFVTSDKIYAVPLYFDTLAMYYNTSIFGKNSIYQPPATWNDVVDYSNLITKRAVGNPNELTLSGFALGTTGNINRSSDILTALMLQSTPIISADKKTYTFNQYRKDPTTGQPVYPGTEALKFYTGFAVDPVKNSYSWNTSMPDDVTAFAQEKTAMILGYAYFNSLIVQINPNLSYRTITLPQIKGSSQNVTLANYWGWAVSRNTKSQDAAWNFLKYLTDYQNVSHYLQASRKPSPFKDSEGGSDSAFEKQKANAVSVYKGDADQFDTIMNDMINDVIKYRQPYQSAIDTATSKAQTMLTKFQ